MRLHIPALTKEILIIIINLLAVAADSACKLHVLGHYSNTFGVNGTQVRVFEEPDQISLSAFLQCQQGS
jgi:hypothetical protein